MPLSDPRSAQMEVSLAERFPVPPISEILGYLAPGSTALAVVYTSEAWAIRRCIHLPVPLHTTVKYLGISATAEGWLIPLLVVGGLALCTYVGGHVIDSIAKLMLDRLIVFKGFGYPYQTLLAISSGAQREERRRMLIGARAAAALEGGDSKQRARRVQEIIEDLPTWGTLSEQYYRGLLFWLNAYLAARWLALISNGVLAAPNLAALASDAAWFIGYACVTFFVLKFFAGFLIRRRIRAVHAAPLRSPGEAFGIRLLGWAFVGPYDILMNPIRSLLKTNHGFDRVFVRRYKRCFLHAFNCRADNAESNNYWLPFLLVMKRAPQVASLLGRYHQLYRFSRNLSTAIYLASIYLLFWYFVGVREGVAIPVDLSAHLLLSVGALIGVAAILLLHFYYLYVCYYSKLLFRTFVLVSDPDNRSFLEVASS